jgi:cytochrome c-type biogenesis protein CcmH
MQRTDDLKQQLAQVDALERRGALDAAAARQARKRLQSTPSMTPDSDLAARPSRRLWFTLVGFVLLFGVVGYTWRGNFEAMGVGPGERGAAAEQDKSAGHAGAPAQIAEMADRLAARLKEQPDDAEGWAMLARSYSVLGRPADAVPAYRRVAELKPNDAQSWADLADGLASAQGNRLDGEPAQLILKALKLDATNVKALALAGTLAFNQGDAKTAALYWERALKQVEPGSDIARQLQGALDEARQLAGQAAPAQAAAAATAAPGPAPTAAAATAAAAGGASIKGRVTLAPALQAQVRPDDTVFIFARPAQGARAPLAILRKQVRDLPLDFTLDDSLSMSPETRLSSAPQVVVGARISKSGSAMAQPGDLQALSAPVAPGLQGLRLQIAEVVR